MSFILGFFSPGPLIKSSLLLINAVAVLSEDRFLARIGWGRSYIADQQMNSFGGAGGRDYDAGSIKGKTIEAVHGIRRGFRIPLIAINSCIIVWELVFGNGEISTRCTLCDASAGLRRGPISEHDLQHLLGESPTDIESTGMLGAAMGPESFCNIQTVVQDVLITKTSFS